MHMWKNGGNIWTHTIRLLSQPRHNKQSHPIWILTIQNNTRPMAPQKILIKFTLVVDDFGLKYLNKEDAQNLLNSIESN